jgi:hypothetical protein
MLTSFTSLDYTGSFDELEIEDIFLLSGVAADFYIIIGAAAERLQRLELRLAIYNEIAELRHIL